MKNKMIYNRGLWKKKKCMCIIDRVLPTYNIYHDNNLISTINGWDEIFHFFVIA